MGGGGTVNEHQKALMGKPSIEGDFCPFCGRRATNAHHVVPRSQGGADGPTVRVCGMGNASGCHGLLHSHRLHMRWDEESWQWLYLRTEEPTKYDRALEMDGWKPLLEPLWEAI